MKKFYEIYDKIVKREKIGGAKLLKCEFIMIFSDKKDYMHFRLEVETANGERRQLLAIKRLVLSEFFQTQQTDNAENEQRPR